MPELSEAYVLGLLADLEVEVPDLRRQLEQAMLRAAAVDAELAQLLRRLDEAKAQLHEAAGRGRRAAQAPANWARGCRSRFTAHPSGGRRARSFAGCTGEPASIRRSRQPHRGARPLPAVSRPRPGGVEPRVAGGDRPHA